MNNQQYIKTVRKRLGLSQTEMGKKIGITQKHISNWETGNCDIPLITLLVYERFADQEHMNIEKPEEICEK